ncbi:MAG: UvrD-helicase domain-containing protein, partial [Fusobacteriaceae bacterium]|nr:UvrD-helicase domain-containing protein [Fusobacteriaceae bacterium]
MSLLNNLNESQREAGKTINGPLLILAGAGSGKTRTITYRIAHMVQEMGISPYHILAVTFTNKAAKEMRERVHNLIGHEAEKIVVSTFHSFGMKMLRMYANFLGYESNFNIYDTDDQTKVVRNILKELGATVQETPKKIVSLISKLKEDGVSPEDYEKTVPSFLENYKVIIETYKKYKIELKKNNAMDFSDLLIFTNELLDNPEILEKVQDRYRYVMVDEYQDTNNIQYQ